MQRLPHEEALNKKSVLPKILKPSIKLKILSDSEADGKAAFDLERAYASNVLSSSLEINEKINKIRSIRGNNAMLNKIKKQMELRRNLEEILKEVEKKTAEIDRKMMQQQDKVNSCKISDKVVINKTFIATADDKQFKVTNYDNNNNNKKAFRSERKLSGNKKVLLPKIKK